MKQTGLFLSLGLMMAVMALPSTAQEADSETGFLGRAAKVDKPIADTYEPLNSTYVGDGERLNQSIEQSWQLKQQSHESTQETKISTDSKERAELEKRIQEPDGARTTRPDPVVESSDGSMRIYDPQ